LFFSVQNGIFATCSDLFERSELKNERFLMSKNLYIISGCNGAGKTTASYTVLPVTLQCTEFVNADEIAKGLSPFNPESEKIAAGRLMMSRIKKLIGMNGDFAIETTLATKTYRKLIQNAHEIGYNVNLLYFWLNSPELALKRVAERVKNGGHNVEEAVVRRRYIQGIKNLFEIYCPLVDHFILIDNSITPSEIFAEGDCQEGITIYNKEKYQMIRKYDNSKS
jgi:Uncharacterized protein conserved in bacteria